jgi:anionic cell wall polymer biosynthesis LytR-Cps2A-Psr (LCP) family protein
MHDVYSHANLRAGPQVLRGRQALAFARNRHDTPDGDFSRSLNQGRLFMSALGELRRDFHEDPAALFTWMSVGWRNVATDLSPRTLLALGLTASQIPVEQVNNFVVPGSTGQVGSASVVFITSAAASLYRDMREDGVIGTIR